MSKLRLFDLNHFENSFSWFDAELVVGLLMS